MMTSKPETEQPNWMEGTYKWCWSQGNVLETAKTSVSILDRGYLYGDGLFETIRIHQGRLFQWDLHWKRLQRGCAALQLPLGDSDETYKERILDLLKRNQTTEALGRIQISRGPGPRGYAPTQSACPTTSITLHHAPHLPIDEPVGWNLMISNFQTPSFSSIPRWKTSNKLFQIMVKKEALDAGFDDGIILNEKQHLTETSSGNLFLIKSNRIYTPTTQCGILNGTTRQLILDMAGALDLECVESPCDVAMLENAESVFATLCSFGLVHIKRVGKQTFPIHPFEKSLYRAYLNHLNVS